MSPGIKLKPITPSRTKILDVAGAEGHYADALNDVIKDADGMFGRTVSTWKNKPRFKIDRATRNNLRAADSTDDEVYRYVVRGTRPHTITVRKARLLRFRSGFKSKTLPRVIGSRAGRVFGPTVFRRSVHHPGTKARDFDTVIAKRLGPRLSANMRQANKRIAQDSQR